MISRVRRWWRTNYYVAMPYVVMVILVFCGYAYTNYAIHKSDHELCELIAPIDAANHRTPPVTVSGRNFAAAIHDQYVKRGCDG